jgi:hypothetical protein
MFLKKHLFKLKEVDFDVILSRGLIMARNISAVKYEQLPHNENIWDGTYTRSGQRADDLAIKRVQAQALDITKTYLGQAIETFEQVFWQHGARRIFGREIKKPLSGKYNAIYEFSGGGSVSIDLICNSSLIEGKLDVSKLAFFLFHGNENFSSDENGMIQDIKAGLSELELSVTKDYVIKTNQKVFKL